MTPTSNKCGDKELAKLVVRVTVLEAEILHLATLHNRDIEEERKLRQLTERLGKEALDKAEKFITEKSASHNDLIQAGIRKEAQYVTKGDLEKDYEASKARTLFLLTVGGFVILLLNFALRFFNP